MASSRRRFGPLFCGVAGFTLIVAVSRPFWESIGEQRQAWGFSRQLRDATSGDRQRATAGLGHLGPAARWWVERATSDPDPLVRQAAVSILPGSDPDRPARILDALVGALGDADAGVRQVAAGQILQGAWTTFRGLRGEATEPAIGALRRALGDSDANTRANAVMALGGFGAAARGAVPDLERAMKTSSNPNLRFHAAQDLLQIEPIGSAARAGAVGELRRMLADPALVLQRYFVAQILTAEIGADATAADLISLIDTPARFSALSVLASLPPGTRGAREAFERLLRGDSSMARSDAALALLLRGQDFDPAPTEVLVNELINPQTDGYTPQHIVFRLRELDPQTVPAVATRLVEVLESPDRVERRPGVILALGAIGAPEVLSTIPAIYEVAMADEPAVALPAIEDLIRIDPTLGARFVPKLIAWGGPDFETETRVAALARLGDLGERAGAAIPTLLRITDEPDTRVAIAAIEAILRIDPERGATLKPPIAGDR